MVLQNGTIFLTIQRKDSGGNSSLKETVKRVLKTLFTASFFFATGFVPWGSTWGDFFPRLQIKAPQAVLYDMVSGMVVFEKNADVAMMPSSMTKALLVYIVFHKISHGELSKATLFKVSKRARAMKGSRMFLERGHSVSVDQLLRGIIVDSGNDACVALEEGIFSTKASAAQAVNKIAQRLGLTRSHFVNTTGWPEEGHLSTAKDLLKVGIRTIQDFPKYYAEYYAQTKLTHNKITQYNRNPLVHRNHGDGLKTGFTEDGGHGLLGSSLQNGRRLVFVINGLQSESERAQNAFALLRWGFRHFDTFKLFSKGDAVGDITIPGARTEKISVITPQDVVVTYPRGHKKRVTFQIEPLDLKVPLLENTLVAHIIIKSPGLPLARKPLVLKEAVYEQSFLQKRAAWIREYLVSLFKT